MHDAIFLAREGIRATMAAYTMAGDRLRTDDFLACFNEDAILESEGVEGPDLFRYEGRARIAGWITRWRDLPDDGRAHRASFVRHHLATSQIDPSGPDAARARTYWVAWTDIGPDHAGYYLDEFRRESGRWLIAHRRIRRDWQAAGSLFHGAIANTKTLPSN